ncbi:MAG: hypothetical protein IKX92_05475 [Clostridia bacterium]|nr:hypothetical protein [Clostridia bacterium]
MTVRAVIIAATLALACGIITVYYNSRFIGRLVRALLDIDALSPESAMTFEELGIKRSAIMRFALRPGASLTKTVIKTADERYYVDPQRADLAHKKYRDEHATVLFVMLLLLAIGVFAIAASYIFPEVYTYAERKFTDIFGQGR